MTSLTQTALLTAEEPALVFGQLASGRLAPALWFAFWCEMLAIGSFVALASGGFWLLFPRLSWNLSRMPVTWLSLWALVITLSAGVVWIHAAWGKLMEASVAHVGGQPERSLGYRFGLYACGWDLLTSPTGLVLALWHRRLRFGSALAAATRAPRPAVHAYYAECRSLPAAAEQGAQKYMGRTALRTVGAGIAVTLLLAVLFAVRDFL